MIPHDPADRADHRLGPDGSLDALRDEFAARVRFALENTDRLERERIEHVKGLISALDRRWEIGDERLREEIRSMREGLLGIIDAQKHAVTIAQDASEKAILKAETANEKRFESANEWRQQSADRERSQQEQMTLLTNTFLPREVADQQFAAAMGRLSVLEAAQARSSGARDQRQRTGDRSQPVALWAAGATVTILLAILIFAANLLTG
jgi:hypothetical protein